MEIRSKYLMEKAEELINNLNYINEKYVILSTLLIKNTKNELEILLKEIDLYLDYLKKYDPEEIELLDKKIIENVKYDINILINIKDIKILRKDINEKELSEIIKYVNFFQAIIKEDLENKNNLFIESDIEVIKLYVNIANNPFVKEEVSVS